MERETQKVKAKINRIKMQADLPLKSINVQSGKIKVEIANLRSKVKNNNPKTLDEVITGSEMWAAIKVYKDNVKRGYIQEKNGYESLQSDEQADYAFESMNEKDYYKYVKLENEKAKELEAKDLERARSRENQIVEDWGGFLKGF